MQIPHRERPRTRREFLARGGAGFGALALLDLLGAAAPADDPADDPADKSSPISPLRPKPPHFAATARSVIFLFMEGGPSHIDLFDPKPLLKHPVRPAHARELRQGHPGDGRVRGALARLQTGVGSSTASPGPGSPTGSRTRPDSWTTWPSSARAGPTGSTTRPASAR